jgi:hypothetical protein
MCQLDPQKSYITELYQKIVLCSGVDVEFGAAYHRSASTCIAFLKWHDMFNH